MPYDFQVVFDAAEPHAQADWWAETLGWTVEPQDEAFIRKMIAEGYATEDDTVTHKGALVWKTGAAIRHPESDRRVLFQSVPEGKIAELRTGRRMHLDVMPTDRSRDDEVARLKGLGATEYEDHRKPDGTGWVTMADPEGNGAFVRLGVDRLAVAGRVVLDGEE